MADLKKLAEEIVTRCNEKDLSLDLADDANHIEGLIIQALERVQKEAVETRIELPSDEEICESSEEFEDENPEGDAASYRVGAKWLRDMLQK